MNATRSEKEEELKSFMPISVENINEGLNVECCTRPASEQCGEKRRGKTREQRLCYVGQLKKRSSHRLDLPIPQFLSCWLWQ